jgi:glycosyltransferase involved in cell wall biosynthesis
MPNREKIKVAVVVDEYFGGAGTPFGGYGFLARNIVCRYLPSDSIQLDVLLARKRSRSAFLPTRHKIDGVTVIEPPSRRWLPLWLCVASYDVYLTIEITHDAVAYDPRPWKRIVHWVQDPRPWYVWRQIQKMKLVREPCFFNPSFNDSVSRAHKSGQVRFISQGDSLNSYARDLYALPDNVPIQYIPNPVPFDPTFDVGSCPKEDLIVFLGRLESQKRVWLFCEIARRLPQFAFVVIGKLHRRSKINETVLAPFIDGQVPNLRFVGHLEGKAKAAYLKRAKILLNTSIWEGIPLSFLEALAVGTVIVSSVNPDDLVARFGVYVGEAPGDGFESIDAFVGAIIKVMGDEERRSATARAAVEYIRERHSIDAFRKSMHGVLMEEAAIGVQKKRESVPFASIGRGLASVRRWVAQGFGSP